MRQLISVLIQSAYAVDSLFARGYSNQAHYSAVGLAKNNRSFAKILIQSYQHTALCMGYPQNFLVAWIALPVSGPYDVISRLVELW